MQATPTPCSSLFHASVSSVVKIVSQLLCGKKKASTEVEASNYEV